MTSNPPKTGAFGSIPDKPPFTLYPERGIKVRDFESEEAAALAVAFLRGLRGEKGINVPAVREHDGRRVVLDYLPGQALTKRPDASMIDSIARVQARIHALDWPNHADRDACVDSYRRYFREYVEVYRLLGILRDREQKELIRQFDARIPWRLHPALIHDDLWGGNVLTYEGDLYLIDYASVKFLALESDLLNSSRYFHTTLEKLTRGPYALRTRYIRVYVRYGARMREVLRNLATNRGFYLAFNSLRKGSNMLRRKPPTERLRIRGLNFAIRRLRHARWTLRA